MTGARTIYLIKRLETRSRTLIEDAVAGLGLTAGQYTTLSLLAGHDTLSSADLARQALITPQSMSEVIAALEKKGLIVRQSSETNRRILHITLSVTGRELLDRAEAAVDRLERALFDALDARALKQLRATLRAVLDAPVQAATASTG